MEQSGFLRDVGKGTVAIVSVEDVLAPATEEEVVEAIVVIVADTDTGHPYRTLQSGLLRDVGEGAVAIVLIQTVGGARRCAIDLQSPWDKDIEPPVVVVVEESNTTTVSFEDILLLVGVAVDDRSSESCFGGDVSELERRIGGGSACDQGEAKEIAASHLIPFPSTAVYIRLADKPCSLSNWPLGQWISISAVCALANPK